MENYVDFEQLTYSIMEKAGYFKAEMGPVHDSMIVGSKKFDVGNKPIFQGEIKEQDFYSDKFQVARYFEGNHNAKWQCLSIKYLDRVVKLEENDHVSTLEFKSEKENFKKVDVPNMSIDSLTLQICGLLGIHAKEEPKDKNL